MRLLFYVEELVAGGAQISAINLGKALTERGHRIWFGADDGPLVSRVTSSGMEFVHVPYNSEKHPSLSIMRTLASVVKTHDIDLVQAFEYYPILESYAISLWLRKPAYGIAAMQATPSYRLPKSRGLALVNAETKERYVSQLGWNASKLRLIVARLDCQYYRPFAPDNDSTLSEYGVRAGDKVALLVTRVHPLKWRAIELFLSAAEHWGRTRPGDRPLRFIVVGGGPLLETLRERASHSSNVPVVVAGERLDIPRVMNESDVVVGMASTCQQALACGRPVIVLGDQGYTEVVSPENFDSLAYHHFNMHSQVGKDQPEKLCRQIEETVYSNERARELGLFGRRIALERLDSRIGARQLEQIYEALIAGNGLSVAGRAAQWGDLLLSLGSLYWFRVRRRVRR